MKNNTTPPNNPDLSQKIDNLNERLDQITSGRNRGGRRRRSTGPSTATGLSLEELSLQVAQKDQIPFEDARRKAKEYGEAQRTLATGQKGIKGNIKNLALAGSFGSRGITSGLGRYIGRNFFRNKSDTDEASKKITDINSTYFNKNPKSSQTANRAESTAKIESLKKSNEKSFGTIKTDIKDLKSQTKKQFDSIKDTINQAIEDINEISQEIGKIEPDVKAIKERISPRDITVGKGNDAQTYRYDPLAPQGKQVRDPSAGARFASKEGGARSDYEKVLNKAAFLGDKVIPTTDRINMMEEVSDSTKNQPKNQRMNSRDLGVILKEVKGIKVKLSEIKFANDEKDSAGKVGSVDDAKKEADDERKMEDELSWRKRIEEKLDEILKKEDDLAKDGKSSILGTLGKLIGGEIAFKVGQKLLGKLGGLGRGAINLGKGAIKLGAKGVSKLISGGKAAYEAIKESKLAKAGIEVGEGLLATRAGGKLVSGAKAAVSLGSKLGTKLVSGGRAAYEAVTGLKAASSGAKAAEVVADVTKGAELLDKNGKPLVGAAKASREAKLAREALAVAKESGSVAAKVATKGVAEGGAKIIGKEALGKIVSKVAGSALGKTVAKSIPFLGAAAGIGFAAMKIAEGDFVGAGLEAAGGLAGPLTAIPAMIASVARDVYHEAYGTYPEQDTGSLVGKRLGEIKDSVTEYVTGHVAQKLTPVDDKKAAEIGKKPAEAAPPVNKAPAPVPATTPGPTPDKVNPTMGTEQPSTAPKVTPELKPSPTKSQEAAVALTTNSVKSDDFDTTKAKENALDPETINHKLDAIQQSIAISTKTMIKTASAGAAAAAAAAGGGSGSAPRIELKLRNDEPSVFSYSASMFDHPVAPVGFTTYNKTI